MPPSFCQDKGALSTYHPIFSLLRTPFPTSWGLSGLGGGSQCRWEGLPLTPSTIAGTTCPLPTIHTAQLDLGKASNGPSMGGPRTTSVRSSD